MNAISFLRFASNDQSLRNVIQQAKTIGELRDLANVIINSQETADTFLRLAIETSTPAAEFKEKRLAVLGSTIWGLSLAAADLNKPVQGFLKRSARTLGSQYLQELTNRLEVS